MAIAVRPPIRFHTDWNPAPAIRGDKLPSSIRAERFIKVTLDANFDHGLDSRWGNINLARWFHIYRRRWWRDLRLRAFNVGRASGRCGQ
jgi:hypothetical protein